jgi:hypothetical protein
MPFPPPSAEPSLINRKVCQWPRRVCLAAQADDVYQPQRVDRARDEFGPEADERRIAGGFGTREPEHAHQHVLAHDVVANPSRPTRLSPLL